MWLGRYVGHGDEQSKHGVGVCLWPEPRSEFHAKTPASDATPGGGAAETQQPEGEVRELQGDRARVHQCVQVYYGCWQDNMMAGHGARRRLHALQLKSGTNPHAVCRRADVV